MKLVCKPLKTSELGFLEVYYIHNSLPKLGDESLLVLTLFVILCQSTSFKAHI